MAQITLKGTPIHTNGELPKVGSQSPDFKLTKTDLSDVSLADFAGKRVVLNVFPSVDTPVCATSVRKFNQQVSSFKDTVVLCVSRDLPFALKRFCGAEGLESVIPASSFRGEKFGSDFGLAPDWWKSSNESICWTAFKTWKKKVYSQIDLKGILNSISPLKLPAVKKVTKTQIKLLMKWISVLDSGETSIGEDRIKDSVGDSVWNSVRDSLLDSVGDSLLDSVWNSEGGFIGLSKINFMRHSVRTFVGAYIISFFPKNKFKTDFNSCIKLWKMGLLPSFDGKTWRLHTGKDAHIIFACKKSKLKHALTRAKK